jgi:phosphate uptake regulator
MLKELFAIFKKDTLLDRAYRRSYNMVDITWEMFVKAKRSLREMDINELDINIHDRDIEVNKYLREVRRNVLSHLTVAGTDDLYSGLILVSIIIDVERVGDYTKNIVDMAINHPAKLHGGMFEEDLKSVEAAVEDTFRRVRKTIETADAQDAENLLNDYQWVNRLCDQHVIDYIKGSDKNISSSDAVSLALYFRYLKRINSHLRNVATSVVNPFDQIGFKRRSVSEKSQRVVRSQDIGNSPVFSRFLQIYLKIMLLALSAAYAALLLEGPTDVIGGRRPMDF